jgi:hypothetical protein
MPEDPTNPRDQAIERVKAKRGFQQMAVTGVLVSIFLVVIWAVSGAGFFWPVFPIVGFGIGMGFAAWNAYGRKPITESEIDQEIERERGA